MNGTGNTASPVGKQNRKTVCRPDPDPRTGRIRPQTIRFWTLATLRINPDNIQPMDLTGRHQPLGVVWRGDKTKPVLNPVRRKKRMTEKH
jgi:hypothetical protein